MDRPHHAVGFGGDDTAGQDFFVATLPALLQAGEGEGLAARQQEVVGLFLLALDGPKRYVDFSVTDRQSASDKRAEVAFQR
jgi:hypothetical protein